MDTAWVAAEMSLAQLDDPRQVGSIVRIVSALAARTDLSLTAACGDGLRQAAHRIFEHPETSVDGLLAGHFAATAQRCAAF
ncbi:MAG: transposase DNA-binding-containing protein, partial [Actinomycetota bacterium]